MNRVKNLAGVLSIAAIFCSPSFAKAQQTAGAYAVLNGIVVSQVVVTNTGSGYSSAPLVSFVGGGGSGAAATATISNGMVTAIAVTSGGFFYTSPPQVIIDPPSTTPFGSSLVLDVPVNGSVVDVSTNHFSITTNNGGTFVTNRFGQPNSAFSLNGIDQAVVLPYNSKLYPDEMTLSAWVNFQQFSGNLWRSGNASDDGWRGFDFRFNPGDLGYDDFNGSWYNVRLSTSTTNLTSGEWLHLVIGRSTNSATMFVNGVKLVSQTNLTAYTKPQITSMLLGAGRNFDNSIFNFCPMALDNVHIYNRALSDAEVQTLFSIEASQTNQPVIVSQPTNQTVVLGNSAMFTVAANGAPNLNYQWWSGSGAITNATNAALTLPNVQLADAGTYYVVVTNQFGSTSSSNATLTVINEDTPFGSSLVLDVPINGSVVDVSTNHFTLSTNNGGTFITNRLGQPNSAFSLNGIDQAVVLPYNSKLYPDEVTLSAWVNFQQFSGNLWRSGNASDDGWRGFDFRFYAGNLEYDDFNGSWYNAILSSSATNLPLGQWLQIVVSRATNSAVLFVNGVKLVSQTNLTAYTKPQITSMLLGAGRNFDNSIFNFCPMALDNVHIYNRTLSDAEVQTLFSIEASQTNQPVIVSQPTNQTVVLGNSAMFTVVANGAPNLNYQWWSGTGAITNATNATLTLPNVQLADSGTYYVVVTNQFGSTSSSNATLTVINEDTPFGSSLVLDVPINGSVVDVSTNHFTLSTNNGGTFITNRLGQPNSAFSLNGANQNIVLPYNANLYPTEITLSLWVNFQAISGGIWKAGNPSADPWRGFQLLFYGNPIGYQDFTGSGYNAGLFPTNETLTGQWHQIVITRTTNSGALFLNGARVASQTNLTAYAKGIGGPMSLGANQNFDGSYFDFCSMALDNVHIYNRALSDAEVQTLFAAELLSTNPPVIVSQPTNQTVASGNDAILNVGAIGYPISYQWWNAGGAITNATNSTLTLTNVQLGNSGDYHVVVTNLYGSVTSSNATLTVTNQPPFITVQPQGSNVVEGSGVSFAVVAGGSKPLSYQWRLDTTNIAGATGNSYTIPAVQPSDAGTYSVVVSNQFDLVLSSNAVLTVVVLPKGMFDDFEPGIDQSQWAAFGGTVLATNYGGSVSPPNSLWFGGTGSRFATTRLLDTTSGGLIEFYLRLARGTLFPWETVDLPSEGVVLEYSVNGGAGWTGIGIYNTPAYTNWTLISLAIPEAAKALAAQFRWRQLANSGQPSDHWALDDVGVNAPAQPPRILVPPTNTTVVVGQTATFSVSAGGTTPLAYQWRSGATTITNATNALLTLTNVQIDQEGYYSVLITNVAGTTNSADVFLNVTYPPAIVRAANTTNMSGIPVTIPIILAANGDESALSFSLNFNTQHLVYASVDPGSGASSASLLANTNQIGSGSIGVTMALSSGTFAPGEHEVALVTFNTPILISGSSVLAVVDFGNQPISGKLSDAGAQPLPVVFTGSTVTLLPSVLESDVAPRPAGDLSLDIFDWVQVGRFVAALDSPTNSGEFQRADCAPRVDQGDGQLKVTDWVQAGRFAANLDAATIVGGPASPIAPLGLKSGFDGKSGSRELRVSDGTAVAGVSFTVPVDLVAQGDENALGFSLVYDPMKLSYAGATKGSAATTTTLNVNTNQTVAGKVGFVMALPTGNQFAAGTRELLRVGFRPSPMAVGTNMVAFGDQPVIRSISDPTANELGANYSATPLVVNPLPSLSIALNAQQAVISWPVWAEGFELQAFGGSSLPATTWTNVSTTIQTNGGNAVVTLLLSNETKFFRLFHP